MTKSDDMQEKFTKYDTFFKKVDELLSITGFSTTELTKKMGISRQTFYAYKNKEKEISEKSLRLLDIALNKAKQGYSESKITTSDKQTNSDIKKLLAIRDQIEQAFDEINARLKNIEDIVNSEKF